MVHRLFIARLGTFVCLRCLPFIASLPRLEDNSITRAARTVNMVWWLNYFPFCFPLLSCHVSNYTFIYVIATWRKMEFHAEPRLMPGKYSAAIWENICSNIRIFIKFQLSRKSVSELLVEGIVFSSRICSTFKFCVHFTRNTVLNI